MVSTELNPPTSFAGIARGLPNFKLFLPSVSIGESTTFGGQKALAERMGCESLAGVGG